MRFHSAPATEVRSPDELMTALKRYLRESNDSEIVVATRIGINRHTHNRWLTTNKTPAKGILALTAFFSGCSKASKFRWTGPQGVSSGNNSLGVMKI
jgi:hypothetical protein